MMNLTLDTLIALVALIVSFVTLGTSIWFWRRSFRPIVTAAVRTHGGGNEAICYDLVLLNSGTVPANCIALTADEAYLEAAFGSDATAENRRRWLACFAARRPIPVLHNGDRVSCSFGTTRNNDAGFWKYNSPIRIVITYRGWFGTGYTQEQEIQVIDSDSFTGFMWGTSST